jgi:aryl-alcohol dehydrogenase-like predicted oxidoreductase
MLRFRHAGVVGTRATLSPTTRGVGAQWVYARWCSAISPSPLAIVARRDRPDASLPQRKENFMDRVRLGKTELQVSPVAFGTWQLGGEWGDVDENEATAAIQHARARGINFFDTAQAYGFGASERLLGRVLRDELEHRRDEIVIATKGGLRMTDDGMVRDSSREWLRQGVEESLRALGTDHVDLFQVHWPDPNIPLAATADALQELVEEGKIRHVGVSNFDVAEMIKFGYTRPVETLQPPYNLFRRDIEGEQLPYAQEHDIGVLVYGPLAHGLLTGAMSEETELSSDDWRSGSPLFHGDAYRRNLDTVRALDRFARAYGHTVAELAVAWVLSHPAVDVAIVGSRSPAHIQGAIDALEMDLSRDELDEIQDIMDGAVPVGGPSPESV